MNTEAARRARQKAIKADLAQAYSDDEACPPEWVDLLTEVRERSTALRADIVAETRRFVADPDIRAALERRSRVADEVRTRVAAVNEKVRRLNLIAPHPRFTRAALDADELLRPLFRSGRDVR